MRDLTKTLAPLTAIAAVMTLVVGTSATAQVVPYPLRSQPNVTTGDVHRYEMDRLRNQADANQALARSQAAQTQATIQTLQAQRQPPLTIAQPTGPLTLEEARRARQVAEARGQTVSRSTSEIDSWLDRSPQ